MSKRSRGSALLAPVPDASQEDRAPEVAGAPQEGIPAHVWMLLQQAGEEAAARLLELLRSPRFKSYAPSAQKALIELALTRAYGLPVRRSLSVSLQSDDADAIAASLMSLQDSLPERSQEGRETRDVTPEGEDTDDT